MGSIQRTQHIILLPGTGMGHLIPFIEFAKKLVHYHDFSITITIPTNSPPSEAQKLVLESLPSSINHIFLPPVNLDDIKTDENLVTHLCLTMNRSMPGLRDTIESIMVKEGVVALVTDMFGMAALDVAKEFNLPLYIFYCTSAASLTLTIDIPKLDEMYSGDYKGYVEPNKLPGSVHEQDIPKPMQDRGSDSYKLLRGQLSRYKFAEGILVNSFVDLEPGAFQAFNREEMDYPPIYPIGPLIKTGQVHGPDGSGCLKWLDAQPNGSVLFISFGSGGTLTTEQLTELALGLELSRQRFLWVVKSPSDENASASYFTAQSAKDPFDFLPRSFLERTKGLGLVVSSWAPQIQILSHDSTGGFLTHCGWNSTLESVVHGVPLIAWPLFAEQMMNAAELVDDVKVALRPKPDENGLVGQFEVARVVKELMKGEEGTKVRNKMNNLRKVVHTILSEDGLSSKSLAKMATKWKNSPGLKEGQEGNELRNKMKDLKNATANVLSKNGSSFKSLAEVALKLKRQ